MNTSQYEETDLTLKNASLEKIVKQQDCVLDVFLSQQNQVSEFYKGLLMISTNLENYINSVQ